MCDKWPAAAFFVILLSACNAVHPERDAGGVIDASQNIAVALYHPVIRPDSPFPGERLGLIRHFYYAARPAGWTLLASGDAAPSSQFEDMAVYLIRFDPDGTPDVLRLARIPEVLTNGVTAPRAHLAMAAPSYVLLDGQLLTRNTSGEAIAYLEDGPLYGGVSFDVPDTVVDAEQSLRLLADTRVRAAALSFDGSTAGYVDALGGLYTLSVSPGAQPEKILDITAQLGPMTVTGIQWEPGSAARLFLRIERGYDLEVYTVEPSIGDLLVSSKSPHLVGEPGAEFLPVVNEIARHVPASIWRIPAPQGFER